MEAAPSGRGFWKSRLIHVMLSLVAGTAFASVPWLIWRSGVDYNNAVYWLFTVHSLPGEIVAILIGGVHGGSISVIIVTNSIFYAWVIYYFLRRRNRRKS